MQMAFPAWVADISDICSRFPFLPSTDPAFYASCRMDDFMQGVYEYIFKEVVERESDTI